MSNPQGSAARIPGGRPLGKSLFGDEPEVLGPPRTTKLAVTSLVLGILSLPAALLLPVYGPLLALIGLVLGIFGIARAERRNLKRTIGRVGIGLSALGLVGGTLWTAAEWHAVDACKSVSVNQVKAYDDCVTNNFKL